MKHRRIRYGGPRQAAKKPSNLDSPVEILSLSLDGRGVARPDGKTLFVRDALPGEQVEVTVEKSGKRYDEGCLAQLITASEKRVEPACQYYGRCGGCDLQHLDSQAAVEMKQHELLTQLAKHAKVEPKAIESPLQGENRLGYRRAARIGINQRETGELLIGFRRRNSSKLIDIEHCPVLTPSINDLLADLRSTLEQFDRIKHLTQIELVEGKSGVVVELRATKNLSDELRVALTDLAQQHQADFVLSIKEGAKTKLNANPAATELELARSLKLAFSARDFVQVNSEVNEQMLSRVIDWLSPQADERALDLFSGLGNFSLPLAQKLKRVTAVEGSSAMVERCLANAAANGIDNIDAYSADLSQPNPAAPWLAQNYDLILLDPPRQGAADIIAQIEHLRPRALVYIACDPSSLVRDAETLTAQGYSMSKLCIADMFPQTHHIESLALFERA